MVRDPFLSVAARSISIHALLAIAVSMSGCASPGNFFSSGSSSTVATVAVSGSVLNGVTGNGVEGVTVSDGTSEATTDADGAYSLDATPSDEGRVALSFSKSAFAPNQRVAEVGYREEAVIDTTLLPAAVTVQIDPGVAQTLVAADSPARVSLPAGGLVDSDGSVVTGTVTASLTPIDASSDPQAMPGDFTARASDGTAEQIESFGALDVNFTDAEGNVLNLGEGQEAAIRIPVNANAENPPATIPLYYYDTEAGIWVEEGAATLAGEPPIQYYEGTVSHFTTWNADQRASTTYVCGRIVSADRELVDPSGYDSIKIHSEGIDFTTYDESPENWTPGECVRRWGILFGCVEDEGTFIVATKALGRARVFAEAASGGKTYRTNSVTLTAGPATEGEACVMTLGADEELVLDLDNVAPKIKVLTSSKKYVSKTPATLTCEAEDEDGDDLTYSWSVTELFGGDEGTLSSDTGSSVTWTPPDGFGNFQFRCLVSDGKVDAEKFLSVYGTDNVPPEISTVTVIPESASAGATVTLSCDAVDEEGDAIDYAWMVSGGTLSSSTVAQPTWTLPSSGSAHAATCSVSDGRPIAGAMETVAVTVSGGSDSGSGTLPSGFPTGLPEGDYQLSLTYSLAVNGTTTAAGPLTLATIPNEGDADAFAGAIVDALEDGAEAVINAGCSASTSYTAFDGTSFTATLAISSCSASGVTYSGTYDYTITKI